MATETTNKDPFGEIAIDKGALWGKQTQRSLLHFNIGDHRFERSFIDALVVIKRCCAEVNCDEKLLNEDKMQAIIAACDDILQGRYDDQFPLHVWQTGSGTQTNMNVNEVIAALATAYLKEKTKKGAAKKQSVLIHPNDHVNMSQSSNDVFPTAMHTTVATQTHKVLLGGIDDLLETLTSKQKAFEAIFTVGRTHMMDALPLSTGAELSAFVNQLASAKVAITESLVGVYALAIGGTAVGSGANAPQGFGEQVSRRLAKHYDLPFKAHANRYAAVSGEDALVRFSASLKQLAVVLNKIANDFRLLGSGPRCGLNEWQLPANEPGSSIMPGKVNPTQCEALSMVCLQVFGNDLTLSMAASQGQLQLNTYRPVIIHNALESITLLSESMQAFAQYCVSGLKVNQHQIDKNMQQNLSAVTLLAPKIGYEVAASIVHEAHEKSLSLAEAAEVLGLFDQKAFSALLDAQLKEQFLG